MVSIILYVIGGLWLLTGFLFGMRRGWLKALCRLGVNLIAVTAAILLTALIAPALIQVTMQILPLGDEIASNPALLSLIAALAQMLLGVLLYLLIFFPIVWHVRLIGSLITSVALPEKHNRARWFNPIGALLGTLSACIVMCAFLNPISELAYLGDATLSSMSTQDEESEPVFMGVLRDHILSPMSEHPFFELSRKLASPIVYETITAAEVNGVKTNLLIESRAAVDLLASGTVIAATPMEQWDETQFEALSSLIDSVGKSRLVSATAVEVLHGATESWSRGESYLGAQKPSLGASLDPTLDLVLMNFGEADYETFAGSLHTLADMVSLLHRHGAFGALLSEDQSALLQAFGSDGLMKELILCLSDDANLRIFVPEMMNICIRILADTIGMKATAMDVYVTLIDDLTQAVLDCAELSPAQRISALTDNLYQVSSRYGMHLTPSGALYLAACLLDDLGDSTPTPERISEWFRAYSGNALPATLRNEQTVSLRKPTFSFTEKTVPLCSASFAGSYPVGITAFALDGKTVTVWSMSDSTLLVRDSEGNVSVPASVDAFSTLFPTVEIRFSTEATELGVIVACNAKDGYEDSFKLITAPRRVTAAEATTANALRPTDMGMIEAMDLIQQLCSRYEGESFPIPTCMRESLVAASKKDGVEEEIPEEVADVTELMEVVRSSVLQDGLSTGNLQTLSDETTMRTNRVTVDQLLLDSKAISDSMPDLDRDAIAQAQSDVISSLLEVIGGATGEGAESSEIPLDAALNALTGMETALQKLEPEVAKPSLVGGILQSDSVKDIIKVESGELSGLTDIVNSDKGNSEQVINDLVATLQMFESATGTDAAVLRDKLYELLHNMTPVGARALGEIMKPSLLKELNVPERAVEGMTSLVVGVFTRLADLKETDATGFEAECDGMQLLLEIAVMKREEIRKDPERLFGEDGILGMTAQDLLAKVMDSDVIAESVLEMLARSTRDQMFALAPDAAEILSLPALTAGNRAILVDAIDSYWNSHAPSLPEAKTANDLASVTGGALTKTDLARRLAAIAAIFRLEYENPYLHLKESAVVRVITFRGEGEGVITITVYQDGAITAVSENGGVAGLYEGNGKVDASEYAAWLIGKGTKTTVNPALTAQIAGLTVTTRNML